MRSIRISLAGKSIHRKPVIAPRTAEIGVQTDLSGPMLSAMAKRSLANSVGMAQMVNGKILDDHRLQANSQIETPSIDVVTELAKAIGRLDRKEGCKKSADKMRRFLTQLVERGLLGADGPDDDDDVDSVVDSELLEAAGTQQ